MPQQSPFRCIDSGTGATFLHLYVYDIKKKTIFVMLKHSMGSMIRLVRWFFYTPTIHIVTYRLRSRTPVRKV
nr:MAG TPA: hypothetical protein [Caudoviricetes sp.]